jgi:hypothetical protein
MKWNLDFTYFRKWILILILLGMAGLGAIGLFLSVEFFTGLFLKVGIGYSPLYQVVSRNRMVMIYLLKDPGYYQ